MKLQVNCEHSTSPQGNIIAPPSKSMAHRSFLAAALSSGKSTISNLVFSKDMEATLSALLLLGAKVERGENFVHITGNAGKFPPVTQVVDCIESGSTLRFLIPLFTHSNSQVTFTGRGRLMQRPQEVYQQLFTEKGLSFQQSGQELTISGQFQGGDFHIDGSVSSQFITGLLFTLPILKEDSRLIIAEPFESRSYVELSRQTLADFGIETKWASDTILEIKGNQVFQAHDYVVEGDCSQAAFWAVLGAVCGGISISGIRPDTLQGDRAIFDILERAGAKFTRTDGTYSYEKSNLKAVDIDLADCPDLGPILMVMAQFAQGKTKIYNAGRLRVKESDRIAAMESELAKLGGSMTVEGDTIYLQNSTLSTALDLDSHNDHRIAMAMAVATVCSGLSNHLSGCESVEKSYPNFFQVLEGAKIKIAELSV